MTNLKTLELRQNKIFARMWINLFKEPIDAVSTNQSKRLNKLHLIFLAKNGMLFMTLLNFTRTVLMVELSSKFLKMGFELEGITNIPKLNLIINNNFSFKYSCF